MDLKVIENLLNLISDSDVNEVTIEEGEFKIKIKKKPDVINQESGGSMPMMYMPQPGAEMQMPQAPPQQASSSAAADTDQSEEKKEAKQEEVSSDTQTIKSPIVGTFYEAPSPDSDPYVNIGDDVSKGQTLCIVEAMKIMNEVESEVTGKIVKRYVDEGQPVEYEQPLFEIELTS